MHLHFVVVCPGLSPLVNDIPMGGGLGDLALALKASSVVAKPDHPRWFSRNRARDSSIEDVAPD